MLIRKSNCRYSMCCSMSMYNKCIIITHLISLFVHYFCSVYRRHPSSQRRLPSHRRTVIKITRMLLSMQQLVIWWLMWLVNHLLDETKYTSFQLQSIHSLHVIGLVCCVDCCFFYCMRTTTQLLESNKQNSS